MKKNENILLQLRQGLLGLSPTLQRLGEFILSEPQKVLYLTITELARDTSTSEASVTLLFVIWGVKNILNSKWRWRWMSSIVSPVYNRMVTTLMKWWKSQFKQNKRHRKINQS